MQKILATISIVAVVALYCVSLYKVCYPTVIVPYPPVYHGTYQPQRQVQPQQPSLAEMPQPTIKPVNVSLNEYHAKAKIYRNKYTIEQHITKYNSYGNGISLASTSTMHSYGGGSTMSGLYNYNQTNYADNSIANGFTPSFNYNIRQSDAYPAVQGTLYNRRPDVSYAYRAIKITAILPLLNDYKDLTLGHGVREVNGKFYYKDWWIEGFKLWIRTTYPSYNATDNPDYYIDELIGAQSTYILDDGTTPPPADPPSGDEFPVGSGILTLILLSAGYVIVKRKHKTSIV